MRLVGRSVCGALGKRAPTQLRLPRPTGDPVSEARDQALIKAVNKMSGSSLTMIGRAAQGTSGGAIFVDLDDGSPGVVSRFLGTQDHACQTARIMARVKALGLPVPAHLQVVAIDQDIFLVQERLAGTPPATVTPAVIDAVVEVNDRFADVLVDEPDVPALPLCLSRSGNPYPRHEILAVHSPRSRRILEAIRSIGLPERDDLAGDDLHHVDLDLSNVLIAPDGTVSGVVDWNLGVYRGNRHQALVKTRFEQSRRFLSDAAARTRRGGGTSRSASRATHRTTRSAAVLGFPAALPAALDPAVRTS